MYNVALCEDEEVFLAAHQSICHEIMKKLNTEYSIDAYKNAGDFLAAFKGNKKRYDIILLDIIMDGMTGMELARTIRKSDLEAVIIFISSSRDYVFEGYDVNALHYLTKPVDSGKLERLIRAAYKDTFQDCFLVFKSGGMNYRVAVKKIIVLETTGRKVEITLQDRVLYYPGTLTELLKKLPKDSFIRCHQGFAVNIRNIRELSRFDAIAVNGKKIPISRAHLKEVQRAFLAAMHRDSHA